MVVFCGSGGSTTVSLQFHIVLHKSNCYVNYSAVAHILAEFRAWFQKVANPPPSFRVLRNISTNFNGMFGPIRFGDVTGFLIFIIFTVDFLIFLAHVGGITQRSQFPNLVGQSLTLKYFN